jgi:tetratricopeptide (TPR) repeat protein
LRFSAALASARFDYDEAGRVANRLLETQEGNPRWEMWAEAELAGYAMIHGRLEEGRERMLRAYEHQERSDSRFTEYPKPVFEALSEGELLLHFREDPAGAASHLEETLASPVVEALAADERGYPAFARLLAEAGRPGRAREVLDAYRSSRDDGAEKEPAFAEEAAEAAIAHAQGDPDGAVRILLAARSSLPDCTLCGLLELGEAYEAMAMPDSAVAAYQAYLDGHALFRSRTDNVRLHRVLLGLGRSLEAMDRRQEAVRHYQRFVDFWREADPVLQPRVEEIRARIRMLEAEQS